jgi:hypothetical protein
MINACLMLAKMQNNISNGFIREEFLLPLHNPMSRFFEPFLIKKFLEFQGREESMVEKSQNTNDYKRLRNFLFSMLSVEWNVKLNILCNVIVEL